MDPITAAALIANTINALVDAWAKMSQGQMTPQQAMACLAQAHADVATAIAQFHQALAKQAAPKAQ